MILNKESIINAKDLQTVEVEVPEWGGSVLVRALSAGDRDEFTQWVTDKEGKINSRDFMTKLVSISLVDEEGNRLFSAEELIELNKKSSKAIDKLFKVVQTNSGMNDTSMDEAKDNLKKAK